MIHLNAPKGLGDALYLRAIALHLLARGDSLTVYTGWPDVFTGLAATVKRLNEIGESDTIDHAMYCLFCRIPAVRILDQFTLTCLQSGIVEPVALRLDWPVSNHKLLADVKSRAGNRPIFIYQPPKLANNEKQEHLCPRIEPYSAYVAAKADCFRIRVGCPEFVQDRKLPCELDLFGKTSVRDVLDLCTIGDLFFSGPSYLLIAAEAMDKPFTCMFSRRGLASGFARVRNVTPERVFHKRHLATSVYDD